LGPFGKVHFLELKNRLPTIRPAKIIRLHVTADIIDKIYIIVRKTDSEQSQLSFFNSSTYCKVKTVFVIIASTNTDKIGITNDDFAIYSATPFPDNKLAAPNAKPKIW
jgi:hypothetical protein